MDYLGINSALQLPQLKDITDTQIVMPTNSEDAVPADNQKLIPVGQPEVLKQAS